MNSTVYNLIIFSFVFFFGISWGSFLNVLIYRIPLGLNPAKGRSFCPNCNHSLGTLDLIPVFSYLFLKGKCRYCKHKISLQYPMIELITGIFTVLAFYRYTILKTNSYNEYYPLFVFIQDLFFITVSIILAKIDLDHFKIPNIIIIPSIIVSFIFSFVNYYFFLFDFVSSLFFAESVIFAIVLLVIVLVVNKTEFIKNLGIGDLKYLIFINFVFGPIFTVRILILSIFLVFLYYIVVKLFFKTKIKEKNNIIGLKFGPSLIRSNFAFGTFLSLSSLLFYIFTFLR